MDSSGEDVDNVRSKIWVFLNYISIAFLLYCLRAELCVFLPSRGLPDLSLLKESVFLFCFVFYFFISFFPREKMESLSHLHWLGAG